MGFDAQHQPHLAGLAADPTRLHGTSSRGHHRWPPQMVAGVGLWSPRGVPGAAGPHGATYGTQDPKELLLKVPSLQEVRGPCLSTPCGIWGWSGPQKVKPNNLEPNPFFGGGLHQGTQPLHALPALFSPGFWSKPQPAIFVVAPVPRQVPPRGAVPMGYCRKLPDGHRSPPGGSRVSAARSH